jgi:general secretion pathway protein B
MSYILDALQKSEKERKNEGIPTLQTIHTPRNTLPVGKIAGGAKHLRWMLLILALIAIILGAMFLENPEPNSSLEQRSTEQNEHQEPSLPSKKPTILTMQKKVRKSAQTTPIFPSQMPIEQDQNTSRAIIREPSPLALTQDNENPVANPNDSKIPLLRELPPSIRDAIPKMKFAGHVYSTDRAQRMIMINQKILREGERVDSGLHLEEITWNGVILSSNAAGRFRIELDAL